MVGGLLGYKVGMTQLFMEGGKLVPVTAIEVGPCTVVQIKTEAKEGYQAAQLSFAEVKKHRINRPLGGHFKKGAVPPARNLKEFRCETGDMTVGQVITAGMFGKGEFVSVTGTSKGKGFQGVMKRHHFAGGPATHGSMFHRAPGSIGASSFPSRVWKNQRMAGHMGSRTVTVMGLQIVEVKAEENILLVRGAVPGSPHGLVVVSKSKKIGKPVASEKK